MFNGIDGIRYHVFFGLAQSPRIVDDPPAEPPIHGIANGHFFLERERYLTYFYMVIISPYILGNSRSVLKPHGNKAFIKRLVIVFRYSNYLKKSVARSSFV